LWLVGRSPCCGQDVNCVTSLFLDMCKILVLLLSCTIVSIGRSEDLIWDRTIMPQPFDSQPFRSVRVPQWLEGTVGCGYTLSVMDTAVRMDAVRHGVTISELGFVNPFFACY